MFGHRKWAVPGTSVVAVGPIWVAISATPMGTPGVAVGPMGSTVSAAPFVVGPGRHFG